MQTIPLKAIPNQTLTVLLGDQSTRINLRQNYQGLFCDLYVNDVLLKGGTIFLNGVRIIRGAYFGFVGDLVFYDAAGSDDPYYAGLGDRFQLLYLEADDLTTLGMAA